MTVTEYLSGTGLLVTAPGTDPPRYERKFVAYEQQLPILSAWLNHNRGGFRPLHPDRVVNNAYFDSLELSAFADNVQGLSTRAKLRYRWYGQSRTLDAGFLEAKRKRGVLGWKERYRLASAPYRPGDTWAEVKERIAREVGPAGRLWLYRFPQPVLINRYQRRYFGIQDGAVRVTVDTALQFWDQRFTYVPKTELRARSTNLLVIEFKFDQDHVTLASSLMQGLPFRASRHSKYVTGTALLRPR